MVKAYKPYESQRGDGDYCFRLQTELFDKKLKVVVSKQKATVE